ncbi:hypothetical protein L218DRAFT_944577 [Marasmius fiardii PR-910]|nr:hypothetical protein L218DRAFT_944577 [Marasmius fiardii PR-910]
MSQPKVKAEETEDEYGRTSNEDEEDDPFAPNPNPDGLITPPPTGQQSTASRSQTAKGKGKLRSLDHLPEKLNTAESTQLQCLKSSLPADEVLLTAEEQRSLAKEFEQRYFAELSKNARYVIIFRRRACILKIATSGSLEVKIKSLERQIKELCEGGI